MTDDTEPRPHSAHERQVIASVRAALEDRLLELHDGAPNGPALWKRLTRDVGITLDRFVTSRQLRRYRALCDASNNDASARAAVIDVWIWLPKRVEVVAIRLAGADN